MHLMRLVQRREIWLPTLLGWAIVISTASAVFVLSVFTIHPYLAANAPIPGARLLIVEGWLGPKELEQAIARFSAGHYEAIVTTGGPIERWHGFGGISSYADLAANYFGNHGLTDAQLVSVPTPASAQDRTFLSAVAVRLWAEKQRRTILKVDVLTSGAHARRSQFLYALALGPESQVGIVSVQPADYDSDLWWRSSAGVKAVLGESIGLAWTICCFKPGSRGSHAELWGTAIDSDGIQAPANIGGT